MINFYEIRPTNHGWGYGYGFFSNYRICLEQLIHHHETDGIGKPYINWDGTTWIEGFNPFENRVIPASYNPFDQWFDQQIPSDGDVVDICRHAPRPDLIHHGLDYFDNQTQLLRQQNIDKQYIKPKQYLIDKVNEIYKNEFEGHIVLGVMARGTEYNLHHPMYGVFGITDYIENIKNVLNVNPEITKLFIVSEDMEYVSEIANAFPSHYFMSDVFRRTDETMEYINRVHCWPNVSTKRPDHCKLLGDEVIIQTKLLGKCDHLLGRLSGVFAGAVLWNDNIKQIHKL